MKQCGIAMLLTLGLLLSACGNSNSSTSGNVNGNWSTTLTNLDGTAAFTFTMTLSQGSGTSVTVSNFSLTTEDACFGTVGTESASFVLTENTNGVATGTYQMEIQSGQPSGNTLTLGGTLSNGAITGTWTLTGTGCAGNGNFTMAMTGA